MRATFRESKDIHFVIYNDQKKQISKTRLSRGAKHSLGPHRVSEMAHQLGLENSQQFHDLVNCILSREEALKIMKRQLPPSSTIQDK